MKGGKRTGGGVAHIQRDKAAGGIEFSFVILSHGAFSVVGLFSGGTTARPAHAGFDLSEVEVVELERLIRQFVAVAFSVFPPALAKTDAEHLGGLVGGDDPLLRVDI